MFIYISGVIPTDIYGQVSVIEAHAMACAISTTLHVEAVVHMLYFRNIQDFSPYHIHITIIEYLFNYTFATYTSK